MVEIIHLPNKNLTDFITLEIPTYDGGLFIAEDKLSKELFSFRNIKQQQDDAALKEYTILQHMNFKSIIPPKYIISESLMNKEYTNIYILYPKFPMSLRKYLEKTNLSEKNFLVLTKTLVDCLSFSKSKNIAHLNINLDSIFVQLENEENLDNPLFFISDFRKYELMNLESEISKENLQFLSPELLKTRFSREFHEINAFKSDMFSLGMVFLQCLTLNLQRPLNEKKYILEDELARLERDLSNSKLKPFFIMMIRNMLMFQPDKRIDYEDFIISNEIADYENFKINSKEIEKKSIDESIIYCGEVKLIVYELCFHPPKNMQYRFNKNNTIYDLLNYIL